MSPPSTGSAQSDASKYPPTEFSLKYAKVLAPNGKLVSPDQVFGEGGIFDKDVEEKTKLAFKVTMKKELFQYESLNLTSWRFSSDRLFCFFSHSRPH